MVGGRASASQLRCSGFESQSSKVSVMVLCLSRSCVVITCIAFSIMITKLKHSLTVWMPYASLGSEQRDLGRNFNRTKVVKSLQFLGPYLGRNASN